MMMKMIRCFHLMLLMMIHHFFLMLLMLMMKSFFQEIEIDIDDGTRRSQNYFVLLRFVFSLSDAMLSACVF